MLDIRQTKAGSGWEEQRRSRENPGKPSGPGEQMPGYEARLGNLGKSLGRHKPMKTRALREALKGQQKQYG